MSLLTAQQETFSTVNLIQSQMVAGTSWNLLWGVIFLLAVTAIFIFPNLFSLPAWRHQDRRWLLLLALTVFWLLGQTTWPGEAAFLRQVPGLLKKSVAEKKQARFCAFDAAVQSGGAFCQLIPFAAKTRQIVPPLAKIKYLTDDFLTTYLYFELSGDYRVVSDATDDFLLIYFPGQAVQLRDDKLIKIADGQEINLGRYQLLEIVGQEMSILRHLKN